MNDIEFNLTDNMINILYNIMNIKEELKLEEISQNKRKKLEKQFIKLRKEFILEFRLNNKEQINKYNEIGKRF